MLDIIKHNVTFYSMKEVILDMIEETKIELEMLRSFWINEPREEMKDKHMLFLNAKLEKLDRWTKKFEDYE